MEHDDRSQQRIVELSSGAALVLAGPGCGKTHILARRVNHAAALGVPFDRMLCITFTNRAAREMKSRITTYTGKAPAGLFVGNIHRFCLRFLYENGIIPPDTSVLDEEDRSEYLFTNTGLRKAADIKAFTDKADYLYQQAHDHPSWVTRSPGSVITPDDEARIRAYTAYKAANRLIDFNDILLMAYTALTAPDASGYSMTGYRWIQVDEVQDMTPLQLAIIEEVCDRADRTAVFFGDEQQAIFSFIGAGGRALDIVKRMSGNRIMRLRRNYRSPGYLVSLCNDVARTWLGISPDFLPDAVKDERLDDALTAYTATPSGLLMMAAHTARRWLVENPHESVTVLVRSNAEGDALSYAFAQVGLGHFHISKQDVFHQIAFKTIWAHLAVVASPMQWHAWAQILFRFGIVRTLTAAQNVVSVLRRSAVSPEHLLHSPAEWAVPRFCRIASDPERTVTVLDTETTGLDVFADDVVQIAAVKVRGGRIVEGSRFEVFISTDKRLPRTLAGGLPNPLLDIYPSAAKLSPQAAFAQFIEYAGTDTVVAGHNVTFDCMMLRQNIRRRTSLACPGWLADTASAIDTLRLSQLLYPSLHSHTLAAMTDHLSLSGVNSHNASDDAAATAQLLVALLPEAGRKAEHIARHVAGNPDVERLSRRVRERYGPLFVSFRAMLETPGGSLGQAVVEAHDRMCAASVISPIPHLNYLTELIDSHIVEADCPPHFRDMLGRYLYDLITYHESDLFACGIVRERLSIMTVHKAKGLEADNVILFDASTHFGSLTDRARILYVAFSRARRRLAVGMSEKPDSILQTALPHFRMLSRSEVAQAVREETTQG